MQRRRPVAERIWASHGKPAFKVRSACCLFSLPGVGKTTIARRLASELRAIWIRIDSIEQAIRDAEVLRDQVDAAGYLAAHAIAQDNLRLGFTVVADCVNDWVLARDAWRDIGLAAGGRVFEIEIVCSDAIEHRRRIEERAADVRGLHRPSWPDVLARDYQSWTRDRLTIDTSCTSVDASVALILDYVNSSRNRSTASRNQAS